jgi:hydrogenase expression/formation protein HypE
VAAEAADAVLSAVRAVPGGSEARLIATVRDDPPGLVLTTTGYGATRIVDMLVGDPLPRIC